MSFDLEMLLKYPMIMQRQSLEEEYYGYIRVKGDHYKIHLIRDMKRYKLDINEDLKDYETKIKKLSRQSIADPVEYLDKLTEILSTEISQKVTVNHTGIYKKVLQEYAELQQFYISIHKSSISADLKTIHLTQIDEALRQHDVTIEVNYTGAGEMFKIISCDLPELKDRKMFEPKDSLIALYENFINMVECPKLQMIFDILDEIDKNCWVLDPEKPKRRDLYRRIALDKNLSIIVTFNPNDIRDLPEIKFLGPHDIVKKYNEILNRNFLNWNPNEDVLSELQSLLEIEAFPSKPEDNQSEELLVNEGECCICFSLRLNDQLPDIICSNSSCNRYFHIECLYQWLCSLNSRKYYHEIYGQCPNCEKQIHCPLPSAK